METKSPAFQLWDGDMLVAYIPYEEDIPKEENFVKKMEAPTFLEREEFRWISSSRGICKFRYKEDTYLAIRTSLIDEDEGWIRALSFRTRLTAKELKSTDVAGCEAFVAGVSLLIIRIR